MQGSLKLCYSQPGSVSWLHPPQAEPFWPQMIGPAGSERCNEESPALRLSAATLDVHAASVVWMTSWRKALSVMTAERRDNMSRKFCWASCSVCKPLNSSSIWRVTSTSVVVSSVATEVNPREWVPVVVVTAWVIYFWPPLLVLSPWRSWKSSWSKTSATWALLITWAWSLIRRAERCDGRSPSGTLAPRTCWTTVCITTPHLCAGTSDSPTRAIIQTLASDVKWPCSPLSL